VARGGIAVWVAAPTRADDSDYMDYLKHYDAYLASEYTSQQLLAEWHTNRSSGHNHGRPSLKS
jgi:hypothetical protein